MSQILQGIGLVGACASAPQAAFKILPASSSGAHVLTLPAVPLAGRGRPRTNRLECVAETRRRPASLPPLPVNRTPPKFERWSKLIVPRGSSTAGLPGSRKSWCLLCAGTVTGFVTMIVRWRPIHEPGPLIPDQLVANTLACDFLKALSGKLAYTCMLEKLEDSGITTHFVCRVCDVPCPE